MDGCWWESRLRRVTRSLQSGHAQRRPILDQRPHDLSRRVAPAVQAVTALAPDPAVRLIESNRIRTGVPVSGQRLRGMGLLTAGRSDYVPPKAREEPQCGPGA